MNNFLYPHAVAALRAARKANSTRPFLARGHHAVRCERCRLHEHYCICAWQPEAIAEAAMCLLMYDTEPLKPTNTGWLIADIVEHTFAFGWSRTGDMQDVTHVLSNPIWQPYVVFPGEYADTSRVTQTLINNKKPLFVLLDGTWTEARKMFRKSPYLDHLPVLSLSPEQCSRYQLRRSCNSEHLCTAEVASLCLTLAGDERAASALDIWFDLFTQHYLAARASKVIDTETLLHRQALTMKRN